MAESLEIFPRLTTFQSPHLPLRGPYGESSRFSFVSFFRGLRKLPEPAPIINQNRGNADSDLESLYQLLDHTTFRNSELLKQKHEYAEALAERDGRLTLLSGELDRIQRQLLEQDERVAHAEATRDEAIKLLAQKRSEIEAASAFAAQQGEDVRRLEAEAETERGRALAAEKSVLDQAQTVKDLEERLSRAAESASALRVRLRDIEEERAVVTRDKAALEEQVRVLENRLRQRDEEIEQTLAKLRGVQSNLDESLKNTKALEELNHRYIADRDALAKKNAEFVRQISTFKAEQEKLSKKLAESESWVFKLAGERTKRERDLVRAERELATSQQRLARCQEEVEVVRQKSDILEVRSREIEAELRSELASCRADMSAASEQHRNEMAAREEDLASCRTDLQFVAQRHQSEIAARDKELESFRIDLQSAAQEHRSALSARYEEIAALTRLLRGAEAAAGDRSTGNDWVHAVAVTINMMPSWWMLLPKSMRNKKRYARLRQKGLFDGERYLQVYPDVVAENMDPLDHYLRHGMAEGRMRCVD